MPSIAICDSLISRVHCWFRQRYLRKKYAGKPPGLYYDSLYRTYVPSVKPEAEVMYLTLLCTELANASLLYDYQLGDGETHEHMFEFVLRDAYEHAKEFSIPEEYLDQYSAQELEFLKKLVERGRRDRREWKG